MANLVAKSACEDLLPIGIGTCQLKEVIVPAITSIALQRGQKNSVPEQLKKSHGLGFPQPNRATRSGGASCIWVGADQALLLGEPVTVLNGASCTDQSDGWAAMRLEGQDAEACLVRLVPIDLRSRGFRTGHAAKTLLFHMPLSIMRSGPFSFDLMVFRSMAKTAIHDLSSAMKNVNALRRNGATNF